MMRIGIMSFAHHHAESYIKALKAIPEIELISIADDDLMRGPAMAAENRSARLFESYEALLAAKPDGVIVCSENVKHRPLVEMAASAGVNVLCEKPLATTLEDGEAMIAACKKAGVHLMTAFPMRFHAAALQVKAALDSGEVGKVRCCNATNQGQNPRVIRAWFNDKALAGGGSVMDHTVHVVDMLRWYMGAEVTEVYAEIDNLFNTGEVDIDTAGLLMLNFDNGVFATLDCSWSRPAFYPTWGNVKIDLICEKGVLHTDYFIQNLIAHYSYSTSEWLHWGSDADAAMIAEFIASIRENRAPSVTGEDGLKAVAVTLAAYESAQAHQPVKL